MIALIPARAGSRRVVGKNTRFLGGHPLVAYAIAAAEQSGVFTHIYVSSDDVETLRIAAHYGAIACARKSELAADDTPDIAWIADLLPRLPMSESFAILRPTSPFRTAATIRRAFERFRDSTWDSMRAIEPVTEHPGKMWILDNAVYGGRIHPLIQESINGTPWHSQPTQVLPPLFKQNSSLEMAWTRVVRDTGTITGTAIGPFFTEGYEGYSIDYPGDFERAEALAAENPAFLPPVALAGVSPPAATQ